MEIKVKDMQKTGWKRCLKKRYFIEEKTIDGEQAIISLSILDKLTESLIINYSFGNILICDNGYKWLQIAIKNKNYWITAMYDDNNNLIQIYMDITKKNYLDNTNNPYFYDLFTDIIITKDERIYVVDEDELQLALEEKIITDSEYNLVEKTTKELVNYLTRNKKEVINNCYNYLLELEKKMCKYKIK